MAAVKNRVDQIIEDIIDREGGFTDHPNDRGGPTKYGVTIKTLTHWLGRQATIDDVRNLNKRTAFEIFYKLYFEAPNIDTLPEAIQPIITDMAVNHGTKNAVQMLQDVLDTCGYKLGALDGICGPKTSSASRACWSQLNNDMIRMIVCRRKAFMQAIVHNHPDQVVFLKGWLNRAESFMV